MEGLEAEKKKYCEKCNTWMAKTQYYDHFPCGGCSRSPTKTTKDSIKVGSKVKFFCEHCQKAVSKSTYYEHRSLYGIASNHFQIDHEDHIPEDTMNLDDHSTDSSSDGQSEIDMEDEDLEFFDLMNEESSDNCDTLENASNAPGNQEEETHDQESSCEYAEEDDVLQNKQINNNHANSSTESRTLLLFLLLWQSIFKVADRAIIVLLKFTKEFLKCIGEACNVEVLIEFTKLIPESMYMVHKYLCLEKDDFEKRAVCPKCKTLYDIDKCTKKKPDGTVISAKCTHVCFPRHPHSTRRKACGAVLMATKKSHTGTTILQPKETYCYKKLTHSLQEMILKKDFITNCEKWRDRQNKIPPDVLGDCFDGQVWKDFQLINGDSFLDSPNNYALMLNVDWFQPTKHGLDTIGVLYLVVMNLPREERFKPENMIIVGIIPGPKEPKLHINTFLQPLVNDLIDLWDGVLLDNNSGGVEMYRAALLALSSDIPATRKCGGFVGHNALKGCTRCYKEFTREAFGDKPDFSGFDRENWQTRTNAQHQADAEKERCAKTPTDAKSISKETGARYSVLYQLPYYDAIRFTIIDPMHNLLLGTAKHVLNVWINEGILSNRNLLKIQRIVDSVKPPSGIGRIPRKIANGFSGFTADQWKNWVCVYSLFALKSVLPKEHYQMWTYFVHACHILCSKVITKEQCKEADRKLLEFCKTFERLCGKKHCTPNMHLHMHLIDCILDYGPVYSFWCFSFERYNGILGDYQTNNINIGVQLMRKFLRDKKVLALQFENGMEMFDKLLGSVSQQRGTLLEQTSTRPYQFYTAMLRTEREDPSGVDFQKNATQIPVPPIKKSSFSQEEMAHLTNMYKKLYSDDSILNISSFCESFKQLNYAGSLFRADKENNYRASTISAQWIDQTSRPATIRRFFSHDVILKKEDGKCVRVSHILAEVGWYTKHVLRKRYACPVEVWDIMFEPFSASSYMPVGRILQSCVVVKHKIPLGQHTQTINVIIPLPKSMVL